MQRMQIEGIHTNSKYTTIAHFYLIKEMIKSKRCNFVSDEDAAIIDSVMRIFSESIKKKILTTGKFYQILSLIK